MRFTDFGSVVKTYKKNFQLRKETFIAERKAIQEKKKKDREDRIEAVKAVQPLIKIKESASKKSNFLGGIKKFLGLMLVGFILQNLKTIISTLQEIYKKIEDLVKRTKEFVEGVIGGLQTFFEGLDGAKRKIDDLLSPILNADLSEFVPFQDQLDKVLTGVLGIAALITGLYQGGKASGGDNLIDETAKGSALGVNIAAQRKAARLKAKQLQKQRFRQRAEQLQKTKQRNQARAASITKSRRANAFRAALDEFSVAQSRARALAQQKAAEEAAQKVKQRTAQNAVQRTALRTKSKRMSHPRARKVAGAGSVNQARVVSGAGTADFGLGKSSTKKRTKTYAKTGQITYTSKGFNPPNLDELFDTGKKPTLKAQLEKFKVPPFQSPEFKAPNIPKGSFKGINAPKIKPGNFFLELVRNEATKEKMLKKTPLIQGPQQQISKPQPSPSDVKKFNQIMKNARGFIKPKNLKLLRGFAKDLGIGLAIEFAAGWAIDRGLEAVGLDEKSLLEERVLRFNQLPKEKQKNIIETYNNNLEKELEYQKTFFAKVDKFIALGDMTANERKIKALAGFLTAVSISGAGSVYDLVSAGPLPDYLGDNVDMTLPFTPKISTPSGMPPLPPTGTGSAALAAAQQYGAARPGGRKHAGVDFDPVDDKNSKFYSQYGGTVMRVLYDKDGYGNYVDIYNAELDKTERIAEGDKVHVKVGDVITPGTLVQSGSTMTGVFHYEIRDGKKETYGFKGTLDPLEFLKNIKSPKEVSIKSSPSNLTSSAGLNQSTTYSDSGVAIRREVNNIIIPIAA